MMLKYKLGYYEIMRVSDSLIWRNDDIERWLTYSPAHSLTMFRVSFAIKNENNFKNYFRNVISNNNNHTQINEWQERIFIDWDIKKWWEVLFLLVLYWKAPLSNTISDEPDVVPGGVADHLLPAALPPSLPAHLPQLPTSGSEKSLTLYTDICPKLPKGVFTYKALNIDCIPMGPLETNKSLRTL